MKVSRQKAEIVEKTVRQSEDFEEEVGKALFGLEKERGEEHQVDYRGNPRSCIPVRLTTQIIFIAKYLSVIVERVPLNLKMSPVTPEVQLISDPYTQTYFLHYS